jgi:toxin-antitoxin system PIN domain toxin
MTAPKTPAAANATARHLLDVNVLLAAIWANHPHHSKAFTWLEGKEILICPLAELGFLRVSTHKKAINAPMQQARTLLAKFLSDRTVLRIPDDLAALDSQAPTSDAVTDMYLADLASKHSAKLGTFDENLKHPAAELIT